MRAEFQKLKDFRILDETFTIQSSLKEADLAAVDAMADAIAASMPKPAPIDHSTPVEPNAMFNFSYGLFILTARDGAKDNGCVINTAIQLTDKPKRISIAVNKANYTHDMIKKTGVFNISMLSTDAPFAMFQHYGFQSGRNVDKFADVKGMARATNGVYYIPYCTNAFVSGKVVQTVEFETHTLFIAEVTEARVLSALPSMTYAYYFANVKPKPSKLVKKTGWVCRICGWIYEGETLPPDIVCPICKHGAADFEKLK
jgi:flavin reductase (DIM6/NTAB) family NADH-FMN oxidoreductase RutF/rubredoxin